MRFAFYLLTAAIFAAGLEGVAVAQNQTGQSRFATRKNDSAPAEPVELSAPVPASYVQPTEKTKVNNYLLESFGPNPLAITALVAGWHQYRRNPPDWTEGMTGYGERYASDFGNSLVNISTRFALSQATHEDTLYYPCSCTGFWPRLGHTVVATVTARAGADGHKVFALPTMVAPYVASTTAVYGWYPRRYNAKDAFRMGNYGLLEYYEANLSLEFLHSLVPKRSGSLIKRLHLNSPHLAPHGETEP